MSSTGVPPSSDVPLNDRTKILNEKLKELGFTSEIITEHDLDAGNIVVISGIDKLDTLKKLQLMSSLAPHFNYNDEKKTLEFRVRSNTSSSISSFYPSSINREKSLYEGYAEQWKPIVDFANDLNQKFPGAVILPDGVGFNDNVNLNSVRIDLSKITDDNIKKAIQNVSQGKINNNIATILGADVKSYLTLEKEELKKKQKTSSSTSHDDLFTTVPPITPKLDSSHAPNPVVQTNQSLHSLFMTLNANKDSFAVTIKTGKMENNKFQEIPGKTNPHDFTAIEIGLGKDVNSPKCIAQQKNGGIEYSMPSVLSDTVKKQSIEKICQLAVNTAEPSTTFTIPKDSKNEEATFKSLFSALQTKYPGYPEPKPRDDSKPIPIIANFNELLAKYPPEQKQHDHKIGAALN